MKKFLLIVLICSAFGVCDMWATPDGDVSQRYSENVIVAPTVQGGVGHVYFTAGSSEAIFNIYSITGQLIKVVKIAEDGHATIDLPKGFYVVRCNGWWSRKVVVK
jgi:hypothetical protein